MEKWFEKVLEISTNSPICKSDTLYIMKNTYDKFNKYLLDKEYTCPLEILHEFLSKYSVGTKKTYVWALSFMMKSRYNYIHPELTDLLNEYKEEMGNQTLAIIKNRQSLSWNTIMQKVEELEGLDLLVARLFTDVSPLPAKEMNLKCGFSEVSNYVKGSRIYFINLHEPYSLEMSDRLREVVYKHWKEGKYLIPNFNTIVPKVIRKLVGKHEAKPMLELQHHYYNAHKEEFDEVDPTTREP